jgi:O-methyltransferase
MKIFDSISLQWALWNCPSVTNANLLQRFSLLRRLAVRVTPEYRFKWPQNDWWDDAKFNAYLERFDEKQGNNSDRRYAVSQLLRLISADLPGDTAEVGAYRGAMSWLILMASQGRRMHHIFDSFEGLSAPSPFDGKHWSAGALACDESTVRENLTEFEGFFKTYKGWVPDRFDDVTDINFVFVHIDVDLYEPTKQSLEFFYPRMVSGGIIICDDWGFTSCPGATQACDEFLHHKPEKMVGLSAGGGLMIKGRKTSPTII